MREDICLGINAKGSPHGGKIKNGDGKSSIHLHKEIMKREKRKKSCEKKRKEKRKELLEREGKPNIKDHPLDP